MKRRFNPLSLPQALLRWPFSPRCCSLQEFDTADLDLWDLRDSRAIYVSQFQDPLPWGNELNGGRLGQGWKMGWFWMHSQPRGLSLRDQARILQTQQGCHKRGLLGIGGLNRLLSQVGLRKICEHSRERKQGKGWERVRERGKRKPWESDRESSW